MSYEKDRLDSFVTSASLSTALAPYVTSASVAAAIGAIDLSAYVSSNSLSAAVATDVLTVRGAATVSATLSAGAVTVAGRPVGPVLLGYQSLTNSRGYNFSGSWSDFCVLELKMFMANGAGTTRTALVAGGTAVLTSGTVGVSSSYGGTVYLATFFGTDGAAQKAMHTYVYDNITGAKSANTTSTANVSFINQIEFSITATASLIIASLYGYRKT